MVTVMALNIIMTANDFSVNDLSSFKYHTQYSRLFHEKKTGAIIFNFSSSIAFLSNISVGQSFVGSFQQCVDVFFFIVCFNEQ